MAALNRVYNVRFAEQAALLEDEQRRLAAGQVRLREALNETERLKQELRTTQVTKKVTPPTLVERALDNGELSIAEPPAPVAAARERPPPEQPPSPPVLDGDMVASSYSRDGDERARVLTPAQIAQIRRKMQEKMAATRRSG